MRIKGPTLERDYEELILDQQESIAEDCYNCPYSSIANCQNQCNELNAVYNPFVIAALGGNLQNILREQKRKALHHDVRRWCKIQKTTDFFAKSEDELSKSGFCCL